MGEFSRRAMLAGTAAGLAMPGAAFAADPVIPAATIAALQSELAAARAQADGAAAQMRDAEGRACQAEVRGRVGRCSLPYHLGRGHRHYTWMHSPRRSFTTPAPMHAAGTAAGLRV